MNTAETIDLSRLPLGNTDFSDIRENGMVYVDKTSIIYKIASKRTPIFLSRPRGFGKSLLVNTLQSLFEQGLKEFHGLDIEKSWNDSTYTVVHIDFSRMANKDPQELKRALGEILIREFSADGIVSQYDAQGILDPDIILDKIACNLINNSIVLLIDEYDAPLTHAMGRLTEIKK